MSPRRARTDCTGGVFGSVLAASVVVGAGVPESFPRLRLALLLLLTGVVFWLGHVHARLFGARPAQRHLDRGTVLHVCRDEWPIAEAALPSALAPAVSPLFGLELSGGLWPALAVAVAGQVGWPAAAARRAGAFGGLVAGTAAVNLVIGPLILVFEVVLTH
ncbi:hypothetical protein ACFY3J_14455 [Streptomyces sp. NPDC001231]|uniref:hypothetical protein n=1 Tax=Streptomyces sp. NPDC001231 TaxID=3364549 RepID=UPI0036A7C76B